MWNVTIVTNLFNFFSCLSLGWRLAFTAAVIISRWNGTCFETSPQSFNGLLTDFHCGDLKFWLITVSGVNLVSPSPRALTTGSHSGHYYFSPESVASRNRPAVFHWAVKAIIQNCCEAATGNTVCCVVNAPKCRNEESTLVFSCAWRLLLTVIEVLLFLSDRVPQIMTELPTCKS